MVEFPPTRQLYSLELMSRGCSAERSLNSGQMLRLKESIP